MSRSTVGNSVPVYIEHSTSRIARMQSSLIHVYDILNSELHYKMRLKSLLSADLFQLISLNPGPIVVHRVVIPIGHAFDIASSMMHARYHTRVV